MSDPAKHAEQIEATVMTATNQPEHWYGTLRRLFAELRTLHGVDSGLPVDSPLRDGTEPETVALPVTTVDPVPDPDSLEHVDPSFLEATLVQAQAETAQATAEAQPDSSTPPT